MNGINRPIGARAIARIRNRCPTVPIAPANTTKAQFISINAVLAGVKEIRDVLVSEYQVEPARCERDLIALLSGLADEGLVEVGNGTLA